MDLPPVIITDEYIPIPKIFQPFGDEGPFQECMICSCDLLDEDDDVQYVIERAFVGDEPIYEFAICVDCQHEMFEELSGESRQRIQAHFEERVDLADRRELLISESELDLDSWIDACVLTKTKRKSSRAHAIYGHCCGSNLLFSYMPYVVSEEGMQGLQHLISKKTRDQLDGFVDDYLGLPPEFKDLPVAFL